MMLHLDLNQLDSLRPRCIHSSQLTGGSSTSFGLAARCAKAGGGWEIGGSRCLSKRRLRWIEVHWVECVCCGSRSSDLLIADSTRFMQLPHVATSFNVPLHFKLFGHLVFIFAGRVLVGQRWETISVKRKLCWDYSNALEALVKHSLLSKSIKIFMKFQD